MPATPDLIIVGASARAAAFSARRAGRVPFWIDQFGDRDLAAEFPGRRVEPGRYPQGLVEALESAPQVPFLYTGALENHLGVLEALIARRPLLGNPPAVCASVRDPWRLADCLQRHGLPFPVLARSAAQVTGGDWLAKPLRGAGGGGITWFEQGVPPLPGTCLQQFVPGESRAGVFAADGQRAVLLGVSAQLVGRREFAAAPFAYCGSIGPFSPDTAERDQWQAVGDALAGEFGLRGLFGVDAVRTPAGAIVPVEVNPRYTASMEVHELARGIACLDHHFAGCSGTLPAPVLPAPRTVIGKAYLFAPQTLRIPAAFDASLPALEEGVLQLADLPHPGSVIPTGAPIMTVLVNAGDEGACARLLARTAGQLYRVLGPDR